MVNTSARRRKSRQRLSIKKPRTPITAYRLTFTPKNVITWVIILAAIVVFAAAISTIFLNPERRINSDLEALAADYYENSIYQRILTSGNNAKDALSKYESTGLTPVSLQQLALLSSGKVSPDYLLANCDA